MIFADFVVRAIFVFVTFDFMTSHVRVPVITGFAITNRPVVDRRTLGVSSANHFVAYVQTLGLSVKTVKLSYKHLITLYLASSFRLK